MRSQFLLDNNYIPLNHGSFGTFPKAVQEALREYQVRLESNPDKFYRRDLELELNKAREALANFVNVETDEVVFVQNTTTGFNAVLKSLKYEEGDKLLYISTVYSSIEKLLQFIHDTHDGKVELIKIEVNHPISDDDYIDKIVKVIQEEKQSPNTKIKLVVIDAISSYPGL